MKKCFITSEPEYQRSLTSTIVVHSYAGTIKVDENANQALRLQKLFHAQLNQA